MARLREHSHLVIEAGTGVGKSFAYLVPAILATAGDEPERAARRIVISTYTISLQEQLITNDLPLLNAVVPLEFTAVLVKGRHNYLSRRRLRGALCAPGRCFARRPNSPSCADFRDGPMKPRTDRWPICPAVRCPRCGMKRKAITVIAWDATAPRTASAFIIRRVAGHKARSS